jgi:hypothetical protein
MWRVHRLDHISAKKPAKLLDSKSLTLGFSRKQIWPVFLPISRMWPPTLAQVAFWEMTNSRTNLAFSSRRRAPYIHMVAGLGVQVAAVALTAGQLTAKLELGRSWGRTFVRVADDTPKGS